MGGDTIDLTGLSYAAGSTATVSGSQLTVNNGTASEIFTLTTPLTTIFWVSEDISGGTLVTAILGTPTANPDRTHVQFHGTVTGAAPGVLTNDSDPIQGDHLIVSAVGGLAANVGHALAGAYGSLTLNADGSFSYSETGALPASGVGLDVFSYTASTGQGGTATSTLTVVDYAANAGNYTAVSAGGAATAANGQSAVLDGGAGNATLTAANGVGAVLIGGPGHTLNGANRGKDTFVFAGDFGQDTINNYIGKTNGNYDVIQLDKSDFANLTAVQNAAQQVGSNTVITYTDPHNHAASTITLTGVSLSSLHFDASHFLLA